MNRDNQFFDRILEERDRQDEKWGKQSHNSYEWLVIMLEEIGEMSEALNKDFPVSLLLEELVQVCAIGKAWYDDMQRFDQWGDSCRGNKEESV